MNIAITNYCNLKCSYCFANKFIESKKEIITEDQVNKILDFSLNYLKYKNQRIGIIGGEPTLHPNFSNILNIISSFSKTNFLPFPTLFTNGTNLKNFDPEIFREVKCLINLNNPDIIGQQQWNNIETGIMRLEYAHITENIHFGINIYHNMPDFSYIFETAKKYNKESIRCSFVAPNKDLTISKEEYYETGKEIFLKFIEQTNKYNIKIHLDCNYIPSCYFNKKEKEMINNSLDFYQNEKREWCNPIFDITPDFKVISCFGINNPINLFDFKDLLEIEHYFNIKQIYPLTVNNNSGKCKNCAKFQNAICQGGCLSFVKKND